MKYDFNNKNKYKSSLKTYWNRWPWEWFLTARLKNQYYGLILKEFRIALQKHENLQIAYMGLYVSYPHPHLHILILGQNKNGKCLADVDPKHGEREWQDITHRSADIENIYDQERVIGYMTDKNMPENHHEKLVAYNIKLLKRMEVK